MNKDFLENRQWVKLLESLNDGPNIIIFKSLADMDSCRSTASYLNMRSKDTKITSILHRKQLVGNFFKGPKGKAEDCMTQKDAILLETARYLPVEAFTDNFFDGFETEDGRRRAKILLNKKYGEKELSDVIIK